MILKAKYIIPVFNEIIEDGFVVIKGTKIDSVGKFADLNKIKNLQFVDFGNSVIMPGFVNSHAHLELTDLYGLQIEDKILTTWISQLMNAKSMWKEEEFTKSIENGVKQSLQSGTTTILDITNSGFSFNVLQKFPIRKIVYNEVIAFDPARAEEAIEAVKIKLKKIKLQDDLMHVGISPHAPYTVSQKLYSRLNVLAVELHLPLCTHVAETNEEVEFLTKGQGAFADFLTKLKIVSKDWIPPGISPIKFLEKADILNKKTLLIHCNYLSDEEISIIHKFESSVAFCPRSHKFFEHKDHPVQKLLQKGINVSIGTDSLASNESLSILDEMKQLYSTFNTMLPQTIIAMATFNGAKAIGMENTIGKIQPGYNADLSVTKIPNENDIYKSIFSSSSENIFTMVNGNVCFDKFNHKIGNL